MLKLILFSSFVGALLLIHQAQTCNEAVCGSIVSKCLLTQSCKCDVKNCTCCKDCINCLSHLYNECCSCVDLCKGRNENEGDLGKKSNVQNFDESLPALFKALTDLPDTQDRWNSITYPIDLVDSGQHAVKKEMKMQMQSAEQEVAPIKANIITLNCTVAFLSSCMSLNKCQSSCQTMGASSYRWFHDGCCECIGPHCTDYGINESRCKECPLKDLDDEDDIENEDDFDYGEDDEIQEDDEPKQNKL